jgi:hypothetical protein
LLSKFFRLSDGDEKLIGRNRFLFGFVYAPFGAQTIFKGGDFSFGTLWVAVFSGNLENILLNLWIEY